MIYNHIVLVAGKLAHHLKESSSVPIGVYVIIGIIAILVTLALILSPRGSRRRHRRNSIFRK